MLSKLKVMKLPIIDPLMKLDPIIKLIGKFTVSAINKLILIFFELFWIPIINNKNKQELYVTLKTKFFNRKGIFFYFSEF